MISWFPNNEIQDMHDRKRHDDQDDEAFYIPLFFFPKLTNKPTEISDTFR